MFERKEHSQKTFRYIPSKFYVLIREYASRNMVNEFDSQEMCDHFIRKASLFRFKVFILTRAAVKLR